MFDPETARLRELLDDMPDLAPAARLDAFPARAITPAERQLFLDACDCAEAAGLRLPRVRLSAREAPATVIRGMAKYNDDGSVDVYLRADLCDAEWLGVLFHELQHAADFRDGTMQRLSSGETELRAMKFSSDMMERVRWI